MAKVKFTEKELLWKLDYNENSDKHGKVFIPNGVFELLATNEELNTVKSFHHAYAYSYLWLSAWLYRNAKYTNDYTKDDIKEIIGFSKTYLKFNYVMKKGGVLDKLGLTVEDKIKNAPIHYEWEDGVLEFYNQEEYDKTFLHEDQIEENKASGIYKRNPNGTYKIPAFGVYNEDGEYGLGTFFGYVENTHQVDFEVFVKCMTNPELGAEAFYLYAFLTWKCAVAGGTIEISGEKILTDTGMKHTSKEKALKGLKKFGLIDCYPADYYKGAGKGDGASVYVVKGIEGYIVEGRAFVTRKVRDAKELKKKKNFVKELMNIGI
ncbi:hypothetical protein MUB16_28485 [Priestia sp. OVL9]|nr:hypothetical protein [Priestia sp. OVL9]